MWKKVYAVKDSKIGVYNLPFIDTHDVRAERSFHAAAEDPNTMISRYPADYELWQIGEFDDETAIFTDAGRHFVCSGVVTVPKKSAEQISLELDGKK